MAMEVIDEYELEKIRAEIQQEKQMKEMLEQSATELKATVEELEKRYDTIDNEGNEWKTRFETQQEINEQLEKQIAALQEKVDEAKKNLKEAKDAAVAAKEAAKARRQLTGRSEASPISDASPANTDNTQETNPTSKTGILINILLSPRPAAGKSHRDMKYDDMADANPHMVRMLEKEKQMLSNQLRDIEWRIDQESKAYHKANDERKQYAVEINATQVGMNDSSARQKGLNTSRTELEPIPGSRTPRDMSRPKCWHVERWHKDYVPSRNVPETRIQRPSFRKYQHTRNIPEDQRILDPKKGPIRKLAAVKSLPSLEAT